MVRSLLASVGDRQPSPPRSVVSASTLLIAMLLLTADPASAEWRIDEQPAEEGDGTALTAETYSRSGAARLEVGCTADDLLYAGVEYAGHLTGADQLRVAYRVDGRGSIEGPWPTAPATGALRVYTTTPIYVDELVRRLRRGATMMVDIELLPELSFDLIGSEETILTVLRRCGGEPPAPAPEMAEEDDGHQEEDHDRPAYLPSQPMPDH